jgi:hypothetical protein
VISYEGLKKAANKSEFKDNAWFVGFAQRRNPEIVVAVLVQSTNLHGGEVAAPIVRDVVKAYFDKKTGKLAPQITAAAGNVQQFGNPAPGSTKSAIPTPGAPQPGAPKPGGQPAGMPEPRQQAPAPAPAKRSTTTH